MQRKEQRRQKRLKEEAADAAMGGGGGLGDGQGVRTAQGHAALGWNSSEKARRPCTV